MLMSPVLDAALAGVFGLLVGSFLNVVIHRTPLVMMREWWSEVASMLGDTDAYRKVFGAEPPTATVAEGARLTAALEKLPAFSLAKPRSRCPHCGHGIRWYENIPVVSYLALRGKCSACEARISPRYPIVELVTGGLFAFIASRWGISFTGAAWAVFASILVVQFLIDFDTQLLPDNFNYVLLWLGLIMAANIGANALRSAVWGVVFGYLSLWVVYHAYRLATGKEGMGHGDFKLLAALGAWFGASNLLALIILSSVVGAAVGGTLLVAGRIANRHIPIPFGPFIAGAGLVAMLAGPRLQEWMPFAYPF